MDVLTQVLQGTTRREPGAPGLASGLRPCPCPLPGVSLLDPRVGIRDEVAGSPDPRQPEEGDTL